MEPEVASMLLLFIVLLGLAIYVSVGAYKEAQKKKRWSAEHAVFMQGINEKIKRWEDSQKK